MKLVNCVSAVLVAGATLASGKRIVPSGSHIQAGKVYPVLKESVNSQLQAARKDVPLFPRVKRPANIKSTGLSRVGESRSLKKRASHTLNTANTLCGNTASSFEDFRCYSDEDCSDWLQLHGDNMDLYYSQNINSEMFQYPSSPLATCQRGRCSLAQKVPEGEVCIGGSPDL
jgi:hypothetical protein